MADKKPTLCAKTLRWVADQLVSDDMREEAMTVGVRAIPYFANKLRERADEIEAGKGQDGE